MFATTRTPGHQVLQGIETGPYTTLTPIALHNAAAAFCIPMFFFLKQHWAGVTLQAHLAKYENCPGSTSV